MPDHLMKIFGREDFGKKGDASWISWILLMGFSVALSALMFGWMSDYAGESSGGLTQRVENLNECDYVSIDIQPCQEHSSNIVRSVVKNRGTLKISQVIFRLYDGSGDVVNRPINKSVWPNDERTLEVLRQGAVDFIEAVPVIFKDTEKGRYEIICSSRIAAIETIPDCS